MRYKQGAGTRQKQNTLKTNTHSTKNCEKKEKKLINLPSISIKLEYILIYFNKAIMGKNRFGIENNKSSNGSVFGVFTLYSIYCCCCLRS
jgi:hypothetical protein